MKKVLAVTAGRKSGNCEILAKEVLMVAEEQGAEVNLLNLHDFNIKICTGCESCTMKMGKGELPECIYKGKDDMDRVMEHFLAADGIVISIPSFVLQPQGLYKTFIDRWLPYEVALLIEAKPKLSPIHFIASSKKKHCMPFVIASNFKNG